MYACTLKTIKCVLFKVYCLFRYYLYKEKCTNHAYDSMQFHKGCHCVTHVQIKKQVISRPQRPPCALLQSLPSPSGVTTILPFDTMERVYLFWFFVQWNHTVYVHHTYITMCSVWCSSLNIVLWDSIRLLQVAMIHPKSESVSAS